MIRSASRRRGLKTDDRRSREARSAMTVSEVLIVLVVVAVLFGLVLPAITMRPGCHGSPNTADSNNMRQIMTAIIAYQGQEESLPIGLPTASFRCRDAADAKEITIRSFEVLADVMQLPNAIWRHPNSPASRAPSTKPDRRNVTSATGPGRWADAAAGVTMDLAYDWAMPDECSAKRIALATRNATAFKGKLVVAVSCDGSVRQCKPAADGSAAGANVTAGSTEADIRCVDSDASGDDAAGSINAVPDSIFNGMNDGLTAAGTAATISVGAQTPKAGSARRCFLK